jgi:hypothetical protein
VPRAQSQRSRASERPVRRIRKSGAAPNLTDEEIRTLTDPDVLATLTRAQLRERKVLRSRAARKRRKERERQAIADGVAPQWRDRYCCGVKQNGEPCWRPKVIGSDFCPGHISRDEARRLGITHYREVSRPAPVKGPEVLRLIFEQAADEIIKPYFEAFGLELQGFDEITGEPIVVKNGERLKLYGESKDGDIEVSPYDDIGGMIAVAEKLLDRVYGKPRQTTQIEGGQRPVRVEPVSSEDHALRVAQLLARQHALPETPERVDAEAVVVDD